MFIKQPCYVGWEGTTLPPFHIPGIPGVSRGIVNVLGGSMDL